MDAPEGVDNDGGDDDEENVIYGSHRALQFYFVFNSADYFPLAVGVLDDVANEHYWVAALLHVAGIEHDNGLIFIILQYGFYALLLEHVVQVLARKYDSHNQYQIDVSGVSLMS